MWMRSTSHWQVNILRKRVLTKLYTISDYLTTIHPTSSYLSMRQTTIYTGSLMIYLLYFAPFATMAKSQRKQNETIPYSDETETCRGICNRRFPAKGIPREAPDTEQHVPPVDTCIRRRAAPSPRRRDDRIRFPTTEERLRPKAKDHRVPFASQLHCELPSQDQGCGNRADHVRPAEEVQHPPHV